MIKELINKANVKDLKESDITGVSNVIQLCAPSDILLIYSRSENQLNTLLANHLPVGFNGLIVSPHTPENNKLNFLIESASQIEKIENQLIEHFYPLPKNLPKLIGVTGTNGKTSVAWTVAELARLSNKTGLYAGTPGVFINGEQKLDQVVTTTPSFLDLRKLMSKYGNEVDVIAIEVSSHALAQKRLKSIHLDSCGWTNFTQDHLDFHKTMEDYFNAKSKIIEYSKDKSIYFSQDEKELIEKAGFEKAKLSRDLVEYDFENLPEVFKIGFPKSNLELALELFNHCFEISKAMDLSTLQLPPGRFQKIESNKRVFIVDYAHTPDALESVLKQVKETFNKKVLTVFGCGGDRDRSKRPLMAQAASKYSDALIVTSDNPRSESPDEIVKDIVKGLAGVAYKSEVDRKKAIQLAFEETNEDWVVLIAGKGHENYQEISGVKYPFDDVLVVKEVLK